MAGLWLTKCKYLVLKGSDSCVSAIQVTFRASFRATRVFWELQRRQSSFLLLSLLLMGRALENWNCAAAKHDATLFLTKPEVPGLVLQIKKTNFTTLLSIIKLSLVRSPKQCFLYYHENKNVVAYLYSCIHFLLLHFLPF